MGVTFDAAASKSYGAIPKGPDDKQPDAGSFEEFLRGLGLKGESDPYRLDLAKFILVTLYIAANFIRPFAQADSKLAAQLRVHLHHPRVHHDHRLPQRGHEPRA
jgi:hypothetical protein